MFLKSSAMESAISFWNKIRMSYIGVSPFPLKNTNPTFSSSPLPLNLKTVESNSPIYLFFCEPPSKNRIFQWTPIFKFSSVTSSHLLKVNKFLVKIYPAPPPKQSHPLSQETPSVLKTEILSAPHPALFENLIGGSITQAQ